MKIWLKENSWSDYIITVGVCMFGNIFSNYLGQFQFVVGLIIGMLLIMYVVLMEKYRWGNNIKEK